MVSTNLCDLDLSGGGKGGQDDEVLHNGDSDDKKIFKDGIMINRYLGEIAKTQLYSYAVLYKNSVLLHVLSCFGCFLVS